MRHLTVQADGVIHHWPDIPDGDHDDLVMRARMVAGIPAEMVDPFRCAVMVAHGELHDKTIALAVNHDLAELDAVDPQALAAYADAHRAALASSAIELPDTLQGLKDLLDSLPGEQRRELWLHLGGDC